MEKSASFAGQVLVELKKHCRVNMIRQCYRYVGRFALEGIAKILGPTDFLEEPSAFVR